MLNPVQIVGILNVTPDSYFDGGKWHSVDAALKRTEEMLSEGADWIDVGGESTGPKSKDVSLEEELKRTIPVISAIHKRFQDAKISIDTYKASVAAEAIAAGASMVNDVTAGRGDENMFAEVAQAAMPDATCPMPNIVLMCSKDSTPRTTIAPQQYEDVVVTIKALLKARRDAAIAAGIPSDRIILDPGLGHFVSSIASYSYQILARLEEFMDLGCPMFLSPSRKSFLAGPKNLPTAERLAGTIAASMIAAQHGAAYIRTHDVKEIARALEVLRDATARGS